VSPVLFSSKSDQHPTPQWLFDLLDSEFDFGADACATAEDTKVPGCYFTPEMDGLMQDWRGRGTIFANPPYGDSPSWVEKMYRSSLEGVTVVALIAARPGTTYWHRFVAKSYEIRFLKGRLKFGNAKNSAPFDSAIVIWKPGRHRRPRVRWVDLAAVQRSLFAC
jgi:site-specific DNA-methyltransferase (adenine-specific)